MVRFRLRLPRALLLPQVATPALPLLRLLSNRFLMARFRLLLALQAVLLLLVMQVLQLLLAMEVLELPLESDLVRLQLQSNRSPTVNSMLLALQKVLLLLATELLVLHPAK